ncbi:MAG: DEAD/DEAH box helicase [Ignavibacteriales bacterium]|nr:MAG: DEAD/DEAH box helicase [Ignavibacteriaceae bacterium]MBW7873768.1 DEAD/DEAH box helicase [Ignavibacteria bacterium]MCZ2143082.1 DEAD/DEAH box helicase [Ignavibacteriales bacterium]MBV6445745.1 hypothetical protein [Ignavibacteriaceae bacterium]MBZ0196382.1 DEAD/DEAH box helicase [Ignavibacteriaceae bacterium]
MSIQIKYNYLEKAYPDMLHGIGMLIQKAKVADLFDSVKLTEKEIGELQKAKELCELKIIEFWDNKNEPEFKALCSTYFDIGTELPANPNSDLFIYEQFKLIVFGYLGEHWHFVKEYLKNQHEVIETLQVTENWNQRLLTISFKAIVYLIKKSNWNDINRSVELINQLREEQNNFENKFLSEVDQEDRPYCAAELISLYHFAKCVDVLGNYVMEGRPLQPENVLQYHTEIAAQYAQKSGNISLILLYQFFSAFAAKMVKNTIWNTTQGINNWVTRFNQFISKRDEKGLFELLYPQRESIIKGELLNPAYRAVVINLPTSSGKTLIAEYRILQALNQFKEQGGWVAYIVPTKALVNQVYIQLNKDLSNIKIQIEKANGAIDLDGFEQHLLEENEKRTNFDILVTTYEKMNLLVRQGLGTSTNRPLVLTVVDEAHNIEEPTRGLNLEFLLSTIKNDCEEANFLLMTPDISNSKDLAEWLAKDRGKVINLELDWWQPNERVIGAVEVQGRARDYDFILKTLHTDKGTYDIGESILIRSVQDSEITASKVKSSKIKIATQVASKVLSLEAPIIVLASSPTETNKVAESLYKSVGKDLELDDDVELVIKLIQSELGDDFPLSKFLKRRIAVHSAALPDEIRFLIEDLMANQKLQALVATTTIAQGINFPASAVIMGSYNYYKNGESKPMPVRDFWNLAGRVGRTGQENMGWVGMTVTDDNDLSKVGNYVKQASEDLHSQLVSAVDNALRHAEESFHSWLLEDIRWSNILQYISHLKKQSKQQSTFIAQLEFNLKATFGYDQLPGDKKQFVKDKLFQYAYSLDSKDAKRADETGFSTVTVCQLINKLNKFQIKPKEWQRNQLFSENNETMQKLIGIMLETYEIKESFKEIVKRNQSLTHSGIARLIIDWVNGKNLADIASKMYPNTDSSIAIQDTTKAIYKIVTNSATWGLAAMQRMPTSGIDWENLSEIEKKKMANLPAYLYYGVNTDEGVLMRKNNIPRSIANRLGGIFNNSVEGEIFNQPSVVVNEWLSELSIETWNKARPTGSSLSGEEYKRIWQKLNGNL